MTPNECARLDTILAKIEALQNATADENARSRLGTAKGELLRLWNESRRDR